MAREKEGYRDNIEQLNRLFPDHEMLTLDEVAKVLNCSARTVRRNLGERLIRGKLNKTTLARYMCGP